MPLVSVLLAVHDDASFVGLAVESVLRQTLRDLELIVVDDASTDDTPTLLSTVSDSRVVVLTNEAWLGLADSLNRGLGHAQGRYVARLDADDVAFPDRLERQVARMHAEPRVAVVGSAVLDLDASDRPGSLHRMPAGPTTVRWHALFGAPFFHPTVLLDRDVIDRRGLRYDPSYLESEDYELWGRLLSAADGANVQEPLVLKRAHAGQASERRAELQESYQQDVALREIARVAPDLTEAELAWRLGSGRGLPEASSRAADAYSTLLAQFEERHGVDPAVRRAAARTLARNGFHRRALELVPTLALHVAGDRARRRVRTRTARREATSWLADLRTPSGTMRVTVVSPEPTPYRAPLFDLVAERPEIDLTVVYASRTVAARTWHVEPQHKAVFLAGGRVPGARRVFRHDYPVTPAIARALSESRPDVVVASGWSTFPSQTAIAWCRAHRIPYVLLVESHDLEPRAGWRRAVKGVVVPRIVRGATSVLAVGTAARDSVVARGAETERVRIFANTIDVPAWIERADRLAARRDRGNEDVVVLSVARLVPEKGLDVLVRALRETDDERIRLVIAGDGPQREALSRLADGRVTMHGEVSADALAELYAEADVFALLSLHEPWGVVVNEAAASGLPLLLSDHVGAASDLLRDGENGFLVPAGDVDAAARALRRLADDPDFRRRAGERSRELVRDWGYGPSVENFVAAVQEATSR